MSGRQEKPDGLGFCGSFFLSFGASGSGLGSFTVPSRSIRTIEPSARSMMNCLLGKELCDWTYE